MTHYFEVIMPRTGVNEDAVTIVEWLFHPGDRVERDDILAHAETTKAAFELECEQSGFFYPLVQAGDSVSFRDVVALILPEPTPEVVEKYIHKRREGQGVATPCPSSRAGVGEIQLTEKARALLEQHNVDRSRLPVGRIVRERDVMALLERGENKDAADIPKKMVVYGASQGGLAVVECVRSMGVSTVVAFLDDTAGRAGTSYFDIPVWAGTELEGLAAKGIGGIATHIAQARIRFALRDRARAAGLVPVNVVHAKAAVAPTVRMGVGNVIKAGAVVDAYVELGDCCIIDNGVILPHNNRIGSGCHLSPGASFGGDCDVGDNTVIGVGAQIHARTRIGSNVIIGVGASVTRDIPDNVIVEGFPARIVGERKR